MAPIVWILKEQATIKTSVFGAEFVAMKQGMECLRRLPRWKLRMMGVAISGPSYIYGDKNMSVIHKQHSTTRVRTKGEVQCDLLPRNSRRCGHGQIPYRRSLSTHNNPAGIYTKSIQGGCKCDHLVGLLLYHIADYTWLPVTEFCGLIWVPLVLSPAHLNVSEPSFLMT